jgi:hypothetical protein
MLIKIKNENRKGQAILFAVVGVTIALAIGVTVASRNLSSSSRVSRTDISARAYAAAEGGIERLLALSDSSLANIALGVTGACNYAGFDDDPVGTTGTCALYYDPVFGDNITSLAELKVETFYYNESDTSNEYYDFSLKNGFTKEVALINVDGTKQYTNSTITICWKNKEAALYYFSYNASGAMRKGALRSSTSTATFPNYADTSSLGFDTYSTTENGYYCKSVGLVASPYGLRIRALYNDTDVRIKPSMDLPTQGYKLTSSGKILQQSEVREIKVVKVYRSLPYMPSFFDSALYSAEGRIN